MPKALYLLFILIIPCLKAGASDNAAADSIRQAIVKAERQGNLELADQSRRNLINAYYYNGRFQELDDIIPPMMEQFASTQSWESYYYAARQYASALFARKELARVTPFTDELMQFSIRHNLDDGIGLAHLFAARTYTYTSRPEEADQAYRQAIESMTRTNPHNPNLAEVYLYYVDFLNRYEELDTQGEMLRQWDEMLTATGLINQPVNAYRLYLNYVNYYLNSKKNTEAKKYLDLAEALPTVRDTPVGRAQFIHVSVDYNLLTGHYNEAQMWVDSLYHNAQAINDGTGLLAALRLKSWVAAKSKRFDEAYYYSQLRAAAHDSVNTVRIAQQLDELRTQYEVERHIIEKERNRTYAILAAALAILMAIAFAIYIIYSRREAARVRSLMEQLARNDVGAGLVSAPGNVPERGSHTDTGQTQGLPLHDADDDLYPRIVQYMHTTLAYTNPALTRNDVATALKSNENYLYKAIKQHTGLTFSEYLYYLRMEHARRLLEDPQNEYTIEAIATESGYRSRKTFHLHFRDRYGMTPDEYRSKQSLLS